MADKKLTDLFNLASRFTENIVTTLVMNDAMNQQFEASLTTDDETFLHEVNDLSADLMTEEVFNAMVEGRDADEVPEDLAEACIALAERLALVATKAFGDEDASQFLAPGSQTDEVSQGFAAHNAPNLSRLSAPKP